MNTDLVPPWQSSKSTQALEVQRYALIELAHLTLAARMTLFDEVVSSDYCWPLIDDADQPHLKREGPWLLEMPHINLVKLQRLEGITCALHGWIESPLNGGELASDLAPAMVVESPQKQRSLLRFYLPSVITQLYKDALDNPANALFKGISGWWYRDEASGWAMLKGKTSPTHLAPWQLSVSEACWKSLHGDPEVMQLAAELVELSPSLFKGICVCERPRQVAKALIQADDHGLITTNDRRAFTYVQLSEGDDAWVSAERLDLLQRATSGEATLVDLLAIHSQQATPC
ncbi:DUF4123 domain-containing protein [Halomonas sp. TD01]|uniref:DUF4123 domain-containing protein n=1 Tax=Halomonas sp. TD01 TaxID=999141 RepID=UPI000214E393|nr:DUF4123 domain-containing protein [Halomonas sp. TD01]EGP18302.1 hypothetical protein GME_17557 [Halomonas sp. TD01]CAH1044466.1 hypothetical protein HPTD01_2944 [Halomonas sp. TD01]